MPCVQYCGVCSTVEGVQYRGRYHEYCGGYLVYRGGYHEYCGGYLEYRGGYSVPWENIMMHVGDIMSTVGENIFVI